MRGSMLMLARRELLLSFFENTEPKILETGVYWSRSYGGKGSSEDWAITEWYVFKRNGEQQAPISGYVGNDWTGHTFQYYGEKPNGTLYKNWMYFNGIEHPTILIGAINNGNDVHISFSIQLSKIDDVYAYHKGTGQIFFVGKNTIYYRHKNISELN